MICVNSVTAYPKCLTLKLGDWYYGTSVEIAPADADCKTVTWHSDNPSVASVNASNGYICANSVGTAKIYATATDGSGCSDYINVTVGLTVPVEDVSLNQTSLSLNEGASTTLCATVCPAHATNKQLNWCSSNPTVAAVNDGVVCALSKGSATITATAADGSGKCACCAVTVTGNTLVTSITVTPAEQTLFLGKSMLLSATVYPSNATQKSVKWVSSDSSVATVNPDSGLVYAQGEGSALIYARALDGGTASGYCKLTVKKEVLVTEIKFSESSYVLEREGILRLADITTVVPENASNKKICWRSSNTSVARADNELNVVFAIGPGKANIYATAQDGSDTKAEFSVHVMQSTTRCEEKPKSMPGGIMGNPIDVYTGASMLSSTLMTLFGGQGLQLIAYYDSTQLACGALGKGWYHNYEKHLERNGNEILVYSTPTSFARYKAQSDCCTTFTCETKGKEGYILTVDDSLEYPYILDCNSEKTEHYDANGNLVKIVSHEGFETSISYTNLQVVIKDCVSGKEIRLDRINSGRVYRVYDGHGREATLNYSGYYLTAICDVNGKSRTYSYNNEGIVSAGTDGNNTWCFSNSYDEYGRVTVQTDGIVGSAPATFEYNDEENKRTTKNRNGKKSYRTYDCNGLLTEYTDENGHTTSYEYDDRYNLIKETDANGNAVTKVYNSFNKPTLVTDKNGNETHFTYDAKGNVTKICYPAVGGVIPEETFAYNSRNQLTQHTDLRGTVTLYTYDENGMPATKKVGSNNAIVYSYENGLLKSETDSLGHTTRYTYNTRNQLISKTDADNKVTRYQYDGIGNLLSTVDANGKSITVTYDGNYQKTAVTDANGNTTEYSYNGNMKNDVVTLPDGHTVRYEFDGENRTTKVTDQENNVTEMTYDDAGRIKTKRMPDGATVQYQYDAVGHVTKETNPKGATVTKTFDKLGNVLTVTDHEGNVTAYEYDAMSRVVKVTNAVDDSTVYEYSNAGDLLSETDALGHTKTYTYDAFGNRLTATDAMNNTTTYTYDQNNNLLTVKDALNHVTTYTYNALNQCVSVKDAQNNVILYGYDALGRRTSVTDARGNTFTTYYDGNGNVIKTTDGKGNTVSETVYSCLNQPLTVTDAMGKVTTYTYNALGKVASVTDSLNRRTEFTYNARGQNTAVLDAASNTSTATYDLLGNVTHLTGPLGGDTAYTYDDMGRLTSESTVSGGTVQYAYNELNVREKVTNARGQITEISYDEVGRITGHTSPEGSVSYTYDANGNVLTVEDSHGTVTRSYDALNRVVSYTDTYGKVIRYEYDAVGNLTRLIYPDNTAVTYAYDANRNLVRVTDWANRVTSYTYDANNRVVGVTKPDGSVTATAYDSMQRVTSTVERTASGTVITGFEYVYDELSRIVEEKVLANSTKLCYTYDSLGRVTARAVKSLNDDAVLSTQSFSYDAAGNVTDAPDSCFGYDTNNRLTVFNGNAVSYDLDGNMLSNGSLSCTYDSANRLISAGGHTYTYNAEDVRIRNLCAEEDTTYTYDPHARLSRLLCKTTNGVITKYVYGRGLIGEEVDGAFKTYHFDSRGSTVAVTDASGTVTDTFAYDTYGKLISRTGTSKVIFGYNGRDGVVTEDNGLIYMRARYYSPDMKRFVNADIVAGELSNAITLNRFAYANGNPVSFVDPFGLWSLKEGWNDFKKWGKEKIVDHAVTTYHEAKDTVVDCYNDVKINAKNIAAKVIDKTSQSIENAKMVTGKIADITKQVVNYRITAAEKFYNFNKDMLKIVINNIEFDAGICIGVGLAYTGKFLGIEAISRMDIVGIQFKDGNFRIGHPGKSGVNITLPTSDPAADVTIGPQNNTYENFGSNYREVEDTTYVDVGKSYGSAAAFGIGYHYDISISYSGIWADLVEYFE